MQITLKKMQKCKKRKNRHFRQDMARRAKISEFFGDYDAKQRDTALVGGSASGAGGMVRSAANQGLRARPHGLKT